MIDYIRDVLKPEVNQNPRSLHTLEVIFADASSVVNYCELFPSNLALRNPRETLGEFLNGKSPLSNSQRRHELLMH